MRFGTITLALLLLAPGGTGRAEPLFAGVGTGTLLHPIQEPPELRFPPSYLEGKCQCCKERVHIFGINGLNPMCLGNFNGMLNYFRKIGFEHTYFAQMYTDLWCAGAIRDIRRNDPDAKIVLIGFSLGANSVRRLANELNRDGIKVDLLIYLVGDFINDTADSFPPNVAKLVNVRAQGLILVGGDLLFNGEDIRGARNYKVACRHILVPSRRETLQLVTDELLLLACSFPRAVPAPAVPASLPAPSR